MSWHVSSVGALENSALYEDGDTAVDGLVDIVRWALFAKKEEHGGWRQAGIEYEADLWFAETTPDLLKRWIDGIEDSASDISAANVLHVKILDIEVMMHRVYTIEEVTQEFFPGGMQS